MTILSAQSIRELCEPAVVGTETEYQQANFKPMIAPFSRDQRVVNGKTYGLSACGYDIRVAEDVQLYGGDFRLASSMEYFIIPPNVRPTVHDKSSWIRQGMFVGNTVLEPGWRGYLTLELFTGQNMPGHLPLDIRAGDPIAQICFQWLDMPTDRPYDGKYQNQPAGPQGAIYEPSNEPLFEAVISADMTDEMEWK